MSNWYLINSDVPYTKYSSIPCYELLSEEDYEVYDYAKSQLPELIGSFDIGDASIFDFNYLQFDPQTITNEEAAVIQKHYPKGVFQVFESFIYELYHQSDNDDNIDLYSTELIKGFINEIARKVHN